MSLSNQEWAEVLGHTRMRVREIGFAELDEEVFRDFRSYDDAKSSFFQYLGTLIAALHERSFSGYQRALYAIRESIQTEDGGSVEGIEVYISDSDFPMFQSRSLDLAELDDLTSLIEELQMLKDDLTKAEN